jgi:hypothetical protein
MIEKQVFVQSPIIAALRSAYFLIIVFLIVLVFKLFSMLPLSFTFLIEVFFIVYGLVLLISLFRKKKTITCDSSGCQVQARNYWQHFGETYYFDWSEVTETLFLSVGSDNSGTIFAAVVNGQQRKLLHKESNSSKSFDDFIALVNQATPHLPYIWTKDADNLKGLEKDGWFNKVAR